MNLKKIETVNGNLFVYLVDEEGTTVGEGFYTNPKGRLLDSRPDAEEEVEWIMRVWDDETLILDASEKVFGYLFKDNKECEPVEIPNLKLSTSSPFANLAEMMKK